jgi:hypothetical protein
MTDIFNKSVNRDQIRIKVEFLIRTIISLWREYHGSIDNNELIHTCSMMATAGGVTIHKTRIPDLVIVNEAELWQGKHVATILISNTEELFQRLTREGVGLPLPLRISKEEIAIRDYADTITNKLMDLYEGRATFPDLETMKAPSYGKINSYTCGTGHVTITIDRAPGVTPITVPCPECMREASTANYKCDQKLQPTHEFYKPSNSEIVKMSETMSSDEYLDMLQTLNNGCLLFRKITEVAND